MCSKIKNIVVTLTFCLFMAAMVVLVAVSAANPKATSESENRPLAQFPDNITLESITNTKDPDLSTIKKFESFTVDQFPMREPFRRLKAFFAMNVLQLRENNGYVIENGSIGQITEEFDRENLSHALKRLMYIYDEYLKNNGGQHYLAVIPDKNYYFSKDHGYPGPDYEDMLRQLQNALPDMEYVELFGQLSLDSYYKTDWHWDQAQLGNVLTQLGSAMGFNDRISGEYKENILAPFYGGYYKQSAIITQPEELIYLTNPVLDDCILFNYTNNKESGLYDTELFNSATQYDLFMSGVNGLMRIDNPNAATDKELVLFRDSFGASIAPLMAEGYKTIYLIDIRNIFPEMLGRFVDFEGKDVLFLYSTTVLGGSERFK